MADSQEVVRRLDDGECWERLRSHELGRLVTHVGNVLDIFPVNYVVDGESLVFRTAEGSKLVELTVNDEVLFEVDDYTAANAWSIVVRGRARRLETLEETDAAEELGLKPWIPTLKYNFVRITATSLSGRAFLRAEEPERHGVSDY